ncbi:Hsp70 family protein [Vibrio chagasii]|nr:Hsp70 family protein [Vibrio chagasii]
MPSVVHYQSDSHTTGDEARANAQTDLKNTIISVKR